MKTYPIAMLSIGLFLSWSTMLVAADSDSQTRPNILFFIADDASAHFGAYGCSWVKTPNIDRLAKNGLVFENAYTPTAKCAPSRAAILTGRNPWQLEEAANHQPHFPSKFKSFTEAMSQSGLYVGAQGKFWGPGSALDDDGKQRKWGLATSGGDGHKDDHGAAFKKFLAARPKGKPFFFWFGSTNPHRAYELDSGVAAGKKTSDIEHVPHFWPDVPTVRSDMLDYAIEVELYDSQVGSLLKVLEESGEADNTLVIVTSDHGMPFPRVKGHNYHLSNRVPFIAHWPKGIKSPGRRVDELLSLNAIAPTFLELHGINGAESGMSSITGVSLTDLFRNEPKVNREIVIIGRERNDVYARPGSEAGLGYPVRGIRKGSLLYLYNFAPERWPCGDVDLGLKDTDASPTKSLVEEMGEQDKYWQFCFGKRPQEELFDLSKDPDCTHNLIQDPKYRRQADMLKEQMFAELTTQQDPRILGKGDMFDNYPTAKKAPKGK